MTNQELIDEFRKSDYVSFTEFLDQYEWVELDSDDNECYTESEE